MVKKYCKNILLVALGSVFGAVILNVASVSAATPASGQTVDERALVERVKEAVIKELLESDFFQAQVDAGIVRFIKKQQQAKARAPNEKAEKNVRPVSRERDHIYGNPDAEISLIEYSDFECPYCKRFHPTAKQIVDTSNGTVNWVYRHFPLGFHKPLAQKEAEASECVAQFGGKAAFWKFADLLYQRTRSNGNGFPVEGLAPLAAEIGLDKNKIQLCIDSGRYLTRVQEDFANGSKSGITGTPGNILLNNRTGKAKVKAGALPIDMLKAEIDRLR